MKTKGRPQSKNIEDRRSPFGSNSLTNISWKGKVNSFIMESHKAGRDYKGPTDYNTLKKAK